MGILTKLVVHRNNIIKAFLAALAALFICGGTILYKHNKTLSESLEIAQNNIVAYLGSLSGSLLANNVLKLTVDELQKQNDSLIHKLDSVSKHSGIKTKLISTAATLTQTLNVKGTMGVRGDIISLIKDTIYKDTFVYNNLTAIYYEIGKDSVTMLLDIKNTLYLYVYNIKQYKNKKNFIKRLFTLDFKKIKVSKYDIVNTNPLLLTNDVRIIEIVK